MFEKNCKKKWKKERMFCNFAWHSSKVNVYIAANEPLHWDVSSPPEFSLHFYKKQHMTRTRHNTGILHEAWLTWWPPVCLKIKQSAHQTGSSCFFSLPDLGTAEKVTCAERSVKTVEESWIEKSKRLQDQGDIRVCVELLRCDCCPNLLYLRWEIFLILV